MNTIARALLDIEERYKGTRKWDATSKGSQRFRVARFTVPHDAQPGQTIHLILEVEDDGTPPMTSYQRVVATVK